MSQPERTLARLTKDDRTQAYINMLEALSPDASLPARDVLAILYDVTNQ